MEIFIFILIVLVLFVLLSLKNNVQSKLDSLEERVGELTRQIGKMYAEKEIPSRAEETKRSEILSHKPKPVEPERIKEPETIKSERPPVFERPIASPPVEPVKKPEPERSPVLERPSFFEANPDLEKFIGENLANKIGIAILVLGIGFFVKYAIDKDWINEIGRVFIGIIAGGVLIGIAHRLRKTFTAFSSVLVGGGIAILYFTIAIAFHEYRIFSQTAAFILMVGITAFTVVLSLGYNRVELAVLAILGGFGSPFMVSTGEGNYIVLFTYMLVLNGGMLVLAYYKKWKIVNIICYIFTILIYGSWLSSRFDGENVPMIAGALIFATLFYLIFFAMNIINNIKERTAFQAAEFIMLLSNTFLYFTAGMWILNNDTGEDFKGLFTVSLAVFNFIFAFMLYKKLNADRNLVFMLIGLVLTFISLAAPIQLEGNYITLFWAAEAVLLLWLSQKSGIQLIKLASIIVMGLMIISLVIDWQQIYVNGSDALMIVLNKGYVTSLVALAALILTDILLKGEKTETFIRTREYRVGIAIGATILLYVFNLLELRHQVAIYAEDFATRELIIGSYNMLFILLLLVLHDRMNIPDHSKKLFHLWSLVGMAAYLFYYHGIVIEARDAYFNGTATVTAFAFHYLLVILLISGVILSLRQLNFRTNFIESIGNAHWWVYIMFFVFISSAELDHTVLLATDTAEHSREFVLNQNHKIGYPILWGITSFLLIAAGLKRKVKTLRIISLVLLSLTLLKLFLIDLKGISEAGKIAAFISLGILLLIVSFMYQRLKKLLLEDTDTETGKA
jgi:uncharacterized membrane protein